MSRSTHLTRQEQYCGIIVRQYEDGMTLLSTHRMSWCLSRTLFVQTSDHCLRFTNIDCSHLANIDHLHLANADHLCLVSTASLSVNLSAFKFHRHHRFSRFPPILRILARSGTWPLISFKNYLLDSLARSVRSLQPRYPHH